MVKVPTEILNNPLGPWLSNSLNQLQKRKPSFIISCMIYICNKFTPSHQIKVKILDLFSNNPKCTNI